MAYLHATGIDVPISIVRMNYEDDPHDKVYQEWTTPFVVVPHWNWRAQAEYGTYGDGSYKHCYPGDASRCVQVGWWVKAFAFQKPMIDTVGSSWVGTLIKEKVDATGTFYRRNRYVDPSTGRFTQEDPIGLAGGLNLYGFGKGDPVSFSDPFGLCPTGMRDQDGFCPGGLTVGQWRRIEYAARSRMTREARATVLQMLRQGRIRVEDLEGNDVGQASIMTERITIDNSFLQTAPVGDLAFVLAHEVGHILQYQDQAHITILFGAGLSLIGRATFVFSGRHQLDADAYACAHSWGAVQFRGGAHGGNCGAVRRR